MDNHAADLSDTVLEVRLLGGFALVRAATVLTVATSLQRLIAFLAIRGPTPRSQVAGVLWSSTPDDRAMASLRTALWRLRHTVPCLLIEFSGSLGLSDEVTVDVARLDAGTDTSLVRAFAGKPWPDLLPGWYDDWVIMERERSRHRYLRLLETVAATAIEDGKLDAALDWALAAAAVDPMRESAHRLVIHALLADGNVGAARRHLAFVQRILREHLGLGPSPHLTALFRHLGTGSAPDELDPQGGLAAGSRVRDGAVTQTIHTAAPVQHGSGPRPGRGPDRSLASISLRDSR